MSKQEEFDLQTVDSVFEELSVNKETEEKDKPEIEVKQPEEVQTTEESEKNTQKPPETPRQLAQEQEQEQEQQEEEAQDTPQPKPYLQVAKKLLETGKWQDAVIAIKGEDGEEQEITLSELEDLDEETFLEIQENQNKFSEDDIKENYISLKELDERKQKLVDIIAKGGDLKQIFGSDQALERYTNPYKGLDLDNEKVQEQIYYNYLTKEKGYSQKAALFELEDKKKELVLDTEVKSIVEGYDTKMKEYVDAKAKELEEQQRQTAAEEKEYKKKLSGVFKEKNFKNESTVRKYLDLATKKTEDGSYAIDELYEQTMSDPEKASELIEFLADRESFLKRVMAEAKTNATRDTLRKISIIKDKKKSPAQTAEENKNNLGLEIQMAE